MKIIQMLFLLLFLISCNREKSCFSENHKTYKKGLDSKFCKGDKLVADLFMTSQLVCLNGYLVVSSNEREKLIYVYSLDGDYIGSYGNKGRASNEVLGMRFNGQQGVNQPLIYSNDVNGRKLVSIDIEATVKQNSFVICDKYDTLPYCVNSFFSNDSTLLVEQQSNNNYKLKKLINGKVKSSKDIYLTSSSDPFGEYFSFCQLSPNKKYMVWAMKRINQINILNLESGERISRSLYTKPAIVDPDNTGTYYCNISVTDKYIYALYMNQKDEDSYKTSQQSEIHIFNWKGKHIKNIVVDEYLYYFDVDDNDSFIYALDKKRDLYRYKIEE